MLSSRILLVFHTCLVVFAIIALRGVRSEGEEEEAEVNRILEGISKMMQKRGRHKPNPRLKQQAAMSLENDMKLTKKQALVLRARMQEKITGQRANSLLRMNKPFVSKWSFPIKYTFDGSHSASEKRIIRQGIQLWQTTTCAQFRELSSASEINGNGIIFKKNQGCWSNVGVVGRSLQTISLGAGCVNAGMTAHEIGHALGMFHEHMRSDRDSYVRINFGNVVPGYEYAFAKFPDDNNDGIPYDYSSIMHYDSLAFSTDYWGKRQVLEPRDPLYLTSMGQQSFVSFNDAKQINMRYHCNDKCSGIQLPQPCENGGYPDPINCAKCRCPPGFGGDFCTELSEGVLNVDSCSSTVITSPSSYTAGKVSGWHLKAPCGSNLVFGFENKPSLSCKYPTVCQDYVEIRTSRDLKNPGYKFCECGISTGRYAVDHNEAAVFFRSGQGKGSGFRLVAYATCPGTSASSLTKECVITKTGYDYAGSHSKDINGRKCQRWDTQSRFNALDFPDETLAAAGSKCRNPDGQSKPWCFIGSSHSFSTCPSIPSCPTTITTTTTGP